MLSQHPGRPLIRRGRGPDAHQIIEGNVKANAKSGNVENAGSRGCAGKEFRNGGNGNAGLIGNLLVRFMAGLFGSLESLPKVVTIWLNLLNDGLLHSRYLQF